MSEAGGSKLELWMKILSAVGAVAVFFWGVYTYRENAQQQRQHDQMEADKLRETRRIEATRPFLEKQLALYSEVTKVAAVLGTSKDPGEVDKAKKRFFELYYGELGLVERNTVARAMKDIKDALDKHDTVVLSGLAYSLSQACRAELAESWGIDNWKR